MKDTYVLNAQTRNPDRPSLQKGQSGGSGPLWKKNEAFCLATSTGGGRGHYTAIRINHGVAEQTRDESLCIMSTYHKGLDNHGARTGVLEGFRIRRLTPTECERLQGFPDGWTAMGESGKKMSDSARYKACGNAVTVNVIEAVMSEIMKRR